MILKERSKPLELQRLEVLNRRISLTTKQHTNYLQYSKGYEGERLFDSLVQDFSEKHIVLTDLLLQFNDTVFQIDSLLITQEKILIYEVKNFTGEYIFEQDKFLKLPQQEIQNPLHQVARSSSLLTQLIRRAGFNLPTQSHVIFVNRNFTLFNAPPNTAMILPTQIEGHLKYLQTIPSRHNDLHKRLMEKLIELHLDKSPYQQQFDYTYEEIKKGITCARCHSYKIKLIGRMINCNDCDLSESYVDSVIRTINEFLILFPDMKLTVINVYELCGELISKKVISHTLQKNFKKMGSNRWTYYVREKSMTE
ncbi:nuclease-related domain-containing protein [Allobacillus sp. GCM10007491]|uniref:NERD domain-containing protein n=1 Tax=Allobacillus saliphilus TaxID=2912308 RepID=A0A941CYP0_9BACI|nr:nuclease-related domain-containing protein [Allobacillus saliphilus]MBR7554868.1 NERD domain-containing protein [Allobacillus saliphilus]